jgi:hypothetical protein
MDAHYEAKQLLIQFSSEGSKRVPKEIVQYLQGIIELTQDLVNNPLGEDWKRHFEQLHQASRDIKQELHAARFSAATAQASERTGRVSSYVEKLKRAPGPAHFLSAHGSTSTPGVAPSELSKDRDIIVKLGDANGIARFRTMRSAEIKKAAETARVRAANPVLAAVEFVAARQLKSGDLCLTLRSAKDAEAARVYRHK